MPEPVRVLFLSLTNDVGSDRIVSELGRNGAACAVLGPAGCYAALSRVVERRFALPRIGTWAATLSLRQQLRRAVGAWRPQQIVPLDELSALLVRAIAVERDTDPALRAVLVRCLGRPAGYAAACHRLALMAVARQAGVATPPFGSADHAGQIAYPLFVKRDHSSGSGGVVMVEDDADLASALRRAGVKRRLKRILARAAGFDHGPDPLLLQGFVPGALVMRTVVAREGATLDGMSLRAVRSNPQTRASTVLEPIESPAMAEAAHRMVAALGCSGFVSFDFILGADGQPLLIEMNPRPIGSTHLGRLFGHDLVQAFLTGRPAPVTEAAETRSVALFPKELERDPDSDPDRDPKMRHDVPWDDPRVVAAYLRHLARLHPAKSFDLRANFDIRLATNPSHRNWPADRRPPISA